VPFWVSINSVSGVISMHIPKGLTFPESDTFSVVAHDPWGATASVSCNIQVAKDPGSGGHLPPSRVQGAGAQLAMPPAPQPPAHAEDAIAPRIDVLAALRPTDLTGQHSFAYYDGAGRLVGSVDAQGFLTESVYDEQANTQQTIRYMQSVTVGASDTLSDLRTRALASSLAIKSEIATTAFDGFGRVTGTTDVNGLATSYTYDAAGRLVRQTAGAGSDARTLLTRYDAFGEVLGTLSGEGAAALLAAHPTPND